MDKSTLTHASHLDLETYRRYVGYEPWSFWGWSCECGGCGKCENCQNILHEYGYQGKGLGRDDIRQALADAEQKAWLLTGNTIGRQYFEEEVALPRDAVCQHIAKIDTWCRYPRIQLCRNHVTRLGVPSKRALGSAEVVYEDINGEPWPPSEGEIDTCPACFTASITLPNPIPDLDEVEVYIGSESRPRKAAEIEAKYQRPATCYIDPESQALIITGEAYLLGNQRLHESGCPLDCKNLEHYAQTIEIYEHVVVCGHEVENACALLISESRPCGCGCCHNAPPACGRSAVPTCGGVGVGKSGLVYVSDYEWDGEVETWRRACCKCCEDATRALIRYEAGLSRPSACQGRYDRLIAQLATGLLPEWCNDCCNQYPYFEKWSRNLAAKYEGGDDKYNLTFEQLNSPWGSTHGAIYAYNELSRMPRVGRGVVI